MHTKLLSLFPLTLVLFAAMPRGEALQPAQDTPAVEEPAPPRVRVPAYPNVACPIMGKPISTRLFVDTEMGRFWVCCKGCDEDVLLYLADAHRTAYPVIEKVTNTVCPVTGKPIPEKDAPRLVLQGFEFSLCCASCVPKARADSQVVLAKLHEPKLVDLGNRTCPVSNEPVDARAFVVIDTTIVRISSAKHVLAVEEEPDKVLARARELRAEELAREKAAKESEAKEKGGAGDVR